MRTGRDDDALNINEFLEAFDAAQEGEVPPTELQAAIAASFEM
jgi:hypothetical protein